jgi:hypothetical protein
VAVAYPKNGRSAYTRMSKGKQLPGNHHKVPLAEVPSNKDAAKVSDKPAELNKDGADHARQKLSWEAVSKPEVKADNKVEAKKALTSEEQGYSDYLTSSLDKASSLIKQTVDLLPSLSIEDASGVKKIDSKYKSNSNLDVNALINKNCETDATKCAPAADALLPGFSFDDSAKPAEIKTVMNSEAELSLSTGDWQAVMQAFRSKDSARAGQVEQTENGYVHRDKSGQADVIKSGDNTILKSTDGGDIIANAAGDKVKRDANGNVEFEFKDGKFMATLESGNKVVIDEKGEQAYIVDKAGNPTTRVFNSANKFEVIGEFKGGVIVTTKETMGQPEDLTKIAHDLEAEAVRTGKIQYHQFANGIMSVSPDKTVVALQNDGTSMVSTGDGRYLVRDANKQISIHEKGKEPVILSPEVLKSIREGRGGNRGELKAAITTLLNFGRDNVLTTDNGTTLKLTNGAVEGNIDGALTTAVKDGVAVNTNLETGVVETVNTNDRTVKVQNADGTVDTIEGRPNGKFRVKGKTFTYDSGKVTTAAGDVVSADNVRLANGTEYKNDGTVSFADGSKITADGTFYSSTKTDGNFRMVSGSTESQAASRAGQAESLAGAIRSKAASGNATASDIASLESAFAGLCDAVRALSIDCDPSIGFKLYQAKGTVAESISTARANLNQNNQSNVNSNTHSNNQNAQANGHMPQVAGVRTSVAA